MNTVEERTIVDFGDQWSRWTDNKGWYGSLKLFEDIISPLIDVESLNGANVAEIGSGSGRIVGMLLDAGVKHVFAIEASADAFQVLKKNIKQMKRSNNVTAINTCGENWISNPQFDYVFSVGLIHHIPDPGPVVKAAYESLKPGGYFFAWLYSYEGNELYVRIIQPIRMITNRLPHILLRIVVELLYYLLLVYRSLSKVFPLPLRSYIEKVMWQLSPQKRRLVIYDQLNPAYAKYYRKQEVIELFQSKGFKSVQIYYRNNYSWSVLGQKPIAQRSAGEYP